MAKGTAVGNGAIGSPKRLAALVMPREAFVVSAPLPSSVEGSPQLSIAGIPSGSSRKKVRRRSVNNPLSRAIKARNDELDAQCAAQQIPFSFGGEVPPYRKPP